MILCGTFLKVSDNSGARSVKCIHVYNKKKFGLIGDLILITVRSYNPKKKIKKGELFISIIIRINNFYKIDNTYIKFNDNSVVLLNKKLLPIATRIFGVSIKNIRKINRKVYLMIPYVF